ncbi:MAG: hypothetical protein ACRC5H_09890, partial [Treponemataceae bacterium]
KKQWGIMQRNEAKDRTNYRHHAIDALTIACINRGQYNLLCEVIRKSPDGKRLNFPKPWETFDTEVLSAVKYIIPKFYIDDNSLRQTKKVLRDLRTGKPLLKNGKKQYIEGDTARGSLHQDTFYGCITTPPEKGKIPEKIYVKKLACSNLTEKEAEKIIDAGIKKAFFNNIESNTQTLADIQEHGILLPYKINGKEIYVKKIRIKAHPSKPIELKKQRDVSKHDYKQSYYVQNDENYLVAIYRGVDKNKKEISDFTVLNLLNAIQSKQEGRELYPSVVTKKESDLSLYRVLKKGQIILLQQNADEDVFLLSKELLWNRIYRIAGLAISSGECQIKLSHCSISESWIYLPSISFDNMSKFRLYRSNKLYCLVEGKDFIVLSDGNIERIKK